MTETATPTDTRPPRTQSRDARRLQVIEATIQSLADRGFSRTTITDVAERAGISHGLVLFHFQSKENLLAETLDYLAEEYRLNWQAALAEAGPAPEARCEDRVSRRSLSVARSAIPKLIPCMLTAQRGAPVPCVQIAGLWQRPCPCHQRPETAKQVLPTSRLTSDRRRGSKPRHAHKHGNRVLRCVPAAFAIRAWQSRACS